MNKSSPPNFDYPWYGVAAWSDLQQGDIFLECPVLVPTEELTPLLIDIAGDTEDKSPVDVQTFNLIVMSQSCDLAHDKVDQVLLCAIFDAPSEKGPMKELRRDQRPSQHLIEKCELEGHAFSQQVVNFRTLYTLPKDFVIAFSEATGERVRMLPPYREHLSQAFARYFMRVGLPRPLN
ncbi:MAG: hypothetical protein IT173_07515 [Acidobacteria bacterium]|nr:hypothetical protein [Acidobacteriota bacterium]